MKGRRRSRRLVPSGCDRECPSLSEVCTYMEWPERLSSVFARIMLGCVGCKIANLAGWRCPRVSASRRDSNISHALIFVDSCIFECYRSTRAPAPFPGTLRQSASNHDFEGLQDTSSENIQRLICNRAARRCDSKPQTVLRFPVTLMLQKI